MKKQREVSVGDLFLLEYSLCETGMRTEIDTDKGPCEIVQQFMWECTQVTSDGYYLMLKAGVVMFTFVGKSAGELYEVGDLGGERGTHLLDWEYKQESDNSRYVWRANLDW